MLGDVIISNEIIQYDFGRLYSDGIEIRDAKGTIKSDPHISALVNKVQTGDSWQRLNSHFVLHLRDLQRRDKGRKYRRPEFSTDVLFRPQYRHKHHRERSHDCICAGCRSKLDPVCEEALSTSCADLGCDENERIRRELSDRVQQAAMAGRKYDARVPILHFGVMGCGNLVIKCAENRDRIAERTGAVAFEMESAGIFQTLPGVVIKAVCDYADSHKNKDWQFHAAATAAAATKAFLEQFTPSDRPASILTSRELTVERSATRAARLMPNSDLVEHGSSDQFTSEAGVSAPGATEGIMAITDLLVNCIELASRIATCQETGTDYRILATGWDVEKTLLLQWAERVRLLRPDYDRRLGTRRTRVGIEEALDRVQHVLQDTANFEDQYGLRRSASRESIAISSITSKTRMKRFMIELEQFYHSDRTEPTEKQPQHGFQGLLGGDR